MVKKLNFLLLCFMILLIFSGCEDFYTFNLFAGLDYVGLPSGEDLEEMETDEALEYLEESIASDSFIEELIEDAEDTPEGEASAVEEIEEFLEEIYTDPEGIYTEDQQITAAVVAAEMELGVNGSDELIDNIFNGLIAMGDMENDPNTDPETAMQSILEGIMPASISDEPDPEVQEQIFTEIITGIMNASDIYQELGNNIITDPASVPEGSIDGGIVMNAIVSGFLDSFIEALLLPQYQNPEDAAAILWEVYSIEPGTDPATITGINSEGVMPEVTDMDYIQNLAIAAGFDLSIINDQEPA